MFILQIFPLQAVIECSLPYLHVTVCLFHKYSWHPSCVNWYSGFLGV